MTSTERPYFYLNSRDDYVLQACKDNAFLCWVDALGAEYAGFIVNCAQRFGLAVKVDIGRAQLPTITSCNKAFYDNWPSAKKRKIEELDDIKHKDKGGFSFEVDKLPTHLARELEILEGAVIEAKTKLSLRECSKYVLVGDHGASRLAVIRRQEEKYETDTRGEHSGRCCAYFEGCDLPYVVDTGEVEGQKRYLVLSDYGRFKGSRAANVEVHGGGTLEEVVVPIITLSLRDSALQVMLQDETVKADRKEGICLHLYVNKAISGQLSVVCNGVFHECKNEGRGNYAVLLPEIKRKCSLDIEVFLDGTLVTKIPIRVAGKSASVNADFDDLF